MADNFGLKIGIEGEKEFKNALRDINQSFKVLGSEMNLVASQFDKQDQSVEAVTARNRVLNKEIDAQREKIGTLEKALANASTSFGENDRRTQAWAIQLNNAKADLNGLEKELAQNNKVLDTAASEFDKAEKQASQFGNEEKDAEKKTSSLASSISALGGHLKTIGSGIAHAAAAGITAVAGAATAAAAAAAGMGKAVLESVDETQKLADVYGMTAEQIQVMRYQGTKLDVDLETLTGTHSKLIKSMNAAQEGKNGPNAQAKAFQELGIAVRDSAGNLRDGNTVYNEAIAALGKCKNETERNALAMTLFGKSAMELNPLIKAGGAELKALSDEAYASGAVISNAATDGLDKFGDSTEALKLSVMGLAGTALAGLMPQLNGVLDGLKSLVNVGGQALKTGDWTAFGMEVSKVIKGLVGQLIDALPGFISIGTTILTSLVDVIVSTVPQVLPTLIGGVLTLVGAIADILTSQGPALITAALNAAAILVTGLLQALPQITQAAIQIVLTLVDGIIANLPSILATAVQTVTTLADGIAQALPKLIPAVVQAIVVIVQTLLDHMDQILNAALQIILGLVSGLLTALPQLIAALPKIILAIVDFLIKAIPQIIDAGIQLLTSLVGALPTIIVAVVQAIPQIVNGVITAVINSIPLIIDAGIKLLVSLIQALPQIIVTIVKAIPQIVTGLVNAIVGNIDKIIMAGVQLLVSLIENLPSIIIEIVKAVPQIITGIVSAFGSYYSKMAETGTSLLKGLWKGISDAGVWLWDKISGFFGDVVDRIKDFFGIHSPSTVFADIGANLGQGIGTGFEQAMRSVSRDMQNAIPTQFDINAGISGTGTLSPRGTTVNQTISVVTPKALSEKELAREFRNLSRKLALEL